jgi:FtsH-binding integral membrane protein
VIRGLRLGWLLRRYGRRGVFLLMFGIIYVVVGVATLTVSNGRRFTQIGPIIGPFLDAPWWGIMWVAAGLAAAAVGAGRARGWRDDRGFGALLIPPAVWTIFYLASVAVAIATNGDFGAIRSLSGAAVWSLSLTVVLLISGWPETTPVADPAVPRDEPGGEDR